MVGIVAYGAYVPRLRLQRSAIAAAHRWMSPSSAVPKGERAYAAWDEDSVTMAVEAARDCLAQRRGARASARSPSPRPPFPMPISSTPPRRRCARLARRSARERYHGLAARRRRGADRERSTPDARRSLLVASDRPRARPGQPREELSTAPAPRRCRLGTRERHRASWSAGSVSRRFVDHFRPATAGFDYYWEERWIRDEGYAETRARRESRARRCEARDLPTSTTSSSPRPCAVQRKSMAKSAGLQGRDRRPARRGLRLLRQRPSASLMLATCLEAPTPGERILVVGFGQGADALVLEVTDAMPRQAEARRRRRARRSPGRRGLPAHALLLRGDRARMGHARREEPRRPR